VADGPSVEIEIWQYFQNRYPHGSVKVIGADLFSGTPANLQSFKNQTGVTYPLLLFCGDFWNALYGDRDNFVVIDPQGIVRYHAQDLWPYGNRYHVEEIRAAVEAWVGDAVGVEEETGAARFRLDTAPNPFRGAVTIELFNASAAPAEATIAVYDLAGRRVEEVWRGAAAPGPLRVDWNAGARRLPAGVYVVRAGIGGVMLSRRIVRVE